MLMNVTLKKMNKEDEVADMGKQLILMLISQAWHQGRRKGRKSWLSLWLSEKKGMNKNICRYNFRNHQLSWNMACPNARLACNVCMMCGSEISMLKSSAISPSAVYGIKTLRTM